MSGQLAGLRLQKSNSTSRIAAREFSVTNTAGSAAALEILLSASAESSALRAFRRCQA